jgi:hypothetical protein
MKTATEGLRLELPLPRVDSVGGPTTPAAHMAVSTMDSFGRLADRSSLRHLGWNSGQRVGFTIVNAVVVVSGSANGPDAISDRGYLRLPAQVRHCARIERSDRLLLAAIREFGMLAIFPPSAASAALWAFDPTVWTQP